MPFIALGQEEEKKVYFREWKRCIKLRDKMLLRQCLYKRKENMPVYYLPHPQNITTVCLTLF